MGSRISGSYAPGGNDQVFIACANGNGTNPTTIDQTLREVRVSRIYTHNIAPGFNGAGITVRGSVRGVEIEDCFVDCSSAAATDTYNAMFFGCPQGDNQGIVVRRTVVLSNGTSGNALLLAGSLDTAGHTKTQGVLLEDCTFQAGTSGTANVGQGQGGIYVTDEQSVNAINNVEFVRCQFIRTAVGTYSLNNSIFGYLRFRKGSIPPNFPPGPLAGRGPGESPTTVSIGASSPATYIATDGFEIDAIVTGGAVSGITLNGSATSVGFNSGIIRLSDGDSLTISFTPGSAPTVTKIAA